MRIITLTVAVFLLFIAAQAQERITRLETVPKFTAGVKFVTATKFQLGVIGSDFFAEKFIGKAPAETVSSFNSHFPVDGFKHAVCGNLVSYYIKTKDRVDDDDVHFIVKPDFASTRFINEHNLQMRDANLVRAAAHPQLKKLTASISSPDIFTAAGIDAYNATVKSLNALVPLLPHFLRDMKKEVLGEVDLVNHASIPEYSPVLPRQELTCACIFGAWVNDRLDVPVVGSYHDFLEIHPVEQVWWTYQKNSNETEYFLGAFGDASGDFYDRGHYDTDGGKLSFNGPWITCPGSEVFALAFEIKNNAPTVTYRLEKLVNEASRGAAFPARSHALLFKSDTLLRMNEQDNLGIQFRDVGIDRIAGTDTFYKGFLVIQNLTGNTNCPGMVFAKVTANKNTRRLLPPTHLNAPPVVKVTLLNIECRSVDDDGGQEEIIGYAGVTAFSPFGFVHKAALLPFDKPDHLLFSRRDNHSVRLRKGEAFAVNETRSFELDNESVVVIKSDLDEDDTNGDDNDDDLDGDDDRLATGGSVKETSMVVKNMPANRPFAVAQVFRSGGTEVVLNFLVEKKEQKPVITR